MKSGSSNWCGETLTATDETMPFRFQPAAAKHASRITTWPSLEMRPSSSAIGTNTPGETMAPAGRRLGADQLSSLELHLGLEHRDELAAVEAFTQLVFQLLPRLGLFQQALVEEGAARGELALGFLERDFGLFQEVGRGRGVF